MNCVIFMQSIQNKPDLRTYTSLLFFLIFLFAFKAKGQYILHESASEIIHYEIENDTIIFIIEDLTDFSLDTAYTNDSTVIDFIQVMIDDNQSGSIDAPTVVDKYYGYTPSGSYLCAGNLYSTSLADACGSLATAGTASASLGVSVTSNTPHLIYRLSLPKAELFNGSHICSRVSVKIHSAGNPTTTVVGIPSTGATPYYVDPYAPLMLFEDLDLGHDRMMCSGDTLFPNESYPYYLWSNNISDSFLIPVDSGTYHLTIKDNTCSLSDTVVLNVKAKEFCEGSKLSFPNVVTPNDDGINDFFEPIPSLYQATLDYSNATLSIYNRWGLQVSGRKQLPPFWDGYLEWGQKAPSGTYFYTYDDGLGNVVNGFFTLVYTER